MDSKTRRRTFQTPNHNVSFLPKFEPPFGTPICFLLKTYSSKEGSALRLHSLLASQRLHGVDVVAGSRVLEAWQRQLNFSSRTPGLLGRWYTKDWWWRWCLYLRLC